MRLNFSAKMRQQDDRSDYRSPTSARGYAEQGRSTLI